MIKKPIKYCKLCRKEYTKAPEGNKIGLSKFCSTSCYIKYSSKEKLKQFDKWAETNPPKQTEIEELKQLLKQEKSVERFVSKSEMKRITILRQGRKQTKNIPERNEFYLEFVRSQSCLVCGKISTAHHTENAGMGIKGSDYASVNLCFDHHVAAGDSVHKLGPKEFQKKFNINFKDQQIKLLIKYIEMKRILR